MTPTTVAGRVAPQIEPRAHSALRVSPELPRSRLVDQDGGWGVRPITRPNVAPGAKRQPEGADESGRQKVIPRFRATPRL